MVFRCNRNDELWFCVHALFRKCFFMQVFSLTSFVKNRLRSYSCFLSEHSVSRVFSESSFWKGSAARSQADEGEGGKEGRASGREVLSWGAALRSQTLEEPVGASPEGREHHRGAGRGARKP